MCQQGSHFHGLDQTHDLEAENVSSPTSRVLPRSSLTGECGGFVAARTTLFVDYRGRFFLLGIVAWTIVAAMYSAIRGSVHDYTAYLDQWANILNGGDPWDGSMPARNAYGPIHTIMAPLTNVHSLAPKVLMVSFFLIVNYMIAWRVASRTPDRWKLVIYWILIPLNGCVLTWGVAYGDNDVLVAALVGLAMLARMDNRLAWAGFLLAIAVLLKLYPAVLIPLFALDRQSLSFRLILSAGTTLLVGFGASFLYWGGNVFSSILFASQRDPSLNSVWILLSEPAAPSPLQIISDAASRYNFVLLAIVMTVWLLLTWRWNLAWLPSSVVGLLLVLLLYKVGHGQFYISWLILAVGLLISIGNSNRILIVACLPAAIGASLVAVGFDAQQEFDQFSRVSGEVFGWVSAVSGLLTITALVVLLSNPSLEAKLSSHS